MVHSYNTRSKPMPVTTAARKMALRPKSESQRTLARDMALSTKRQSQRCTKKAKAAAYNAKLDKALDDIFDDAALLMIDNVEFDYFVDFKDTELETDPLILQLRAETGML